jgi:hypothetical protein
MIDILIFMDQLWSNNEQVNMYSTVDRITLLHKVSAGHYSGDMTKINTTKQGRHSATGFP